MGKALTLLVTAVVAVILGAAGIGYAATALSGDTAMEAAVKIDDETTKPTVYGTTR